MCQNEIKILTKNNKSKCFSIDEFAEILKVSKGAVYRAIAKLKKWNDIDFDIINQSYKTKLFKYKECDQYVS